ncbi:channel accessory protein ArfC, sunset domain variant [Mycobacterium colombiense]
MSHMHWWLVGLSFGLGFALTLTLKVTPVKSQAPVSKSPGTGTAPEPATAAIPVTEKRTTKIPVTERRTTKIPIAKEPPTTKIPPSPRAPYGPGSADPDPDGRGPAGYLIKARGDGKVYFTPDDPSYDSTAAEIWFSDEKSAQQAGFTPWRDSPDNPRRR